MNGHFHSCPVGKSKSCTKLVPCSYPHGGHDDCPVWAEAICGECCTYLEQQSALWARWDALDSLEAGMKESYCE